MDRENSIKLFEEKTIRTHWDTEKEKWYFSIVDVIAVLINSENPQTYWCVMKKRLIDQYLFAEKQVVFCEKSKLLEKEWLDILHNNQIRLEKIFDVDIETQDFDVIVSLLLYLIVSVTFEDKFIDALNNGYLN